MVEQKQPMSISQYLDYSYPLNGLVGDRTGRHGRIKIHHLGECAITIEWQDGELEKINVAPGCAVYAPDDYDSYLNRHYRQPAFEWEDTEVSGTW